MRHDQDENTALFARVYKGLKGLVDDVATVAKSPSFLEYGGFLGPSKAADLPGFSSQWYANQLEEEADHQQNLLLHFLNTGYRDGLSPHPIFSADRESPVLLGLVEGRRTTRITPLFDGAYWAKNCGLADSGINIPILHYLQNWQQYRRSFSPLVRLDYLRHGLANQFMVDDPLTLYFSTAPSDRPDPHPLFDGAWYRAENELKEDEDAFEHFLLTGLNTGRAPNPYAFKEDKGDMRHTPKAAILAYLAEGIAP